MKFKGVVRPLVSLI